MEYSLIANSGIHITILDFDINIRERFSLWFHEWYDTTDGVWVLDLAQEVNTETNRFFYKKKDLFEGGYLTNANGNGGIDVSSLNDEGIKPLKIDDQMQLGVPGDIFRMNFTDRENTLASFENKWLPIPYFLKRTETRFDNGPYNWSRFKLVPQKSREEGIRSYKVLLAFDTRTSNTTNQYSECPVFSDFNNEKRFEVCKNEYMLMDFFSPKRETEYINNYLFGLVHPNVRNAGLVHTGRRLSYIATYFLLIDYIAQKNLFPKITLYKDANVVVKDVDMVVDIGNSRTTALLVEDNSTFNQVEQLELIDYTSLLNDTSNKVNIYKEPFDMRLAFRKVEFGNLGIQGSKQFVYPSLVRLGKEANYLIHRATESDSGEERLSTMSSPKRYLWDGKRSDEEWKFMVLEGEKANNILDIPGISEHLQSDGRIANNASGGQSYHYSRRSLMTFAFLEMLTQAQTQINSDRYRTDRGNKTMPRRIRRIIVTCPTAMSKLEREALVKCASDAVKLLNLFKEVNYKVDVVPAAPSFRDSESKWYYDEATCSQLVYIYGEVGYKYKGSCQEFFNLYGKVLNAGAQPELTIGSLDIGAGTSDLMISRYSYLKGDVTTITPNPLFYDSFYYAGDEMLNELIKKVMFFSQDSAFRKKIQGLDETLYRQTLRNFFGPDYAGQTVKERKLRRDFNLQYTVPLMYYFLELLSNDSKDCVVRYADVFDECPPNDSVKEGFKGFFGFCLEEMEWKFNATEVADVVSKAFEPLLKKIATIMYAFNCDIVLLSGRPASLSPIRDLFLKYYSVSPNRLILLNNYYVGHWYPFSNNTGYIANAKTIVAMGALIGHYASSLSVLDKFIIDISKLDENLKSVINYIESSREGQPVEYFITPEKNRGELMVSSLPTTLNIRQIGFDSYPARKLYVIDFNEYRMRESIRNKAISNNQPKSDAQVRAEAKEIKDGLRLRLPYQLTIERDDDDKEKLMISSITDKNGVDLADSMIEINIQSLGAEERYWLDTGVFEIQ
jgi:hypothetical protein